MSEKRQTIQELENTLKATRELCNEIERKLAQEKESLKKEEDQQTIISGQCFRDVEKTIFIKVTKVKDDGNTAIVNVLKKYNDKNSSGFTYKTGKKMNVKDLSDFTRITEQEYDKVLEDTFGDPFSGKEDNESNKPSKQEEKFETIKRNGKYNFMDRNGNLLSDEWFDKVGDFHEGLAGVIINDKRNFIDKYGKLLSPNQWFDGCCNFHEGFACVRLNEKLNYIDENGKILSPNLWFDLSLYFQEGFGRVRLNGKWNFIDKNGKIVFPNQWFEDCGVFSEGFASVKLNGKWNYIDKNGKIAFPNQWFDLCFSFNEGFAKVLLNGREYFIDENGRIHDKRPNIKDDDPEQKVHSFQNKDLFDEFEENMNNFSKYMRLFSELF